MAFDIIFGYFLLPNYQHLYNFELYMWVCEGE